MNEQCVLCGEQAAVRVRGTSFCAACGLSHYSVGGRAPKQSVNRSKRAALLALFSSGVFVKVLLGAVALAAVGGVAASGVFESAPADSAAVETTVTMPTTTEGVATVGQTEPAALVVTSPSAEQPGPDASVVAYVAAVQEWADCVSLAASEHTGEAFDPTAACPGKPAPGDYGLTGYDTDEPPGNSGDAPGHDEAGPGNSEDAPGHDEAGPGNSENAPGINKDQVLDS
jgi:hypothetical protein